MNHLENQTNQQKLYRKGLAVTLLLWIFAIDLIAVYQLFPNFLQVVLFGGILGVQTLLIMAYHQRCLDCPGCMEKAGPGIRLFYLVFAAIGGFSVLLIALSDLLIDERLYLKIVATTTYAALLTTGISTAFKAIIGVRNFSDCQENSTNPIVPEDDGITENTHTSSEQNKITVEPIHSEKAKVEGAPDALYKEQDTLNRWRQEEENRREKSQRIQQQQKAERRKAKLRSEDSSLRTTFEFPHIPQLKEKTEE